MGSIRWGCLNDGFLGLIIIFRDRIIEVIINKGFNKLSKNLNISYCIIEVLS